jgi:hypothetical protein
LVGAKVPAGDDKRRYLSVVPPQLATPIASLARGTAQKIDAAISSLSAGN